MSQNSQNINGKIIFRSESNLVSVFARRETGSRFDSFIEKRTCYVLNEVAFFTDYLANVIFITPYLLNFFSKGIGTILLV